MDFENSIVILTYFFGNNTEVFPCLTARYVGVYNRIYYTDNLKGLSASAENCVGVFLIWGRAKKIEIDLEPFNNFYKLW